MNGALRDTARRWRAAGRPAVVVEVARTAGSVPRETGTRMLVAADAVCGSIGGGHLELQAIAQARTLLAAPVPAPRDQHIALGPGLGQCCGGALDLRYGLLADDDPAAWPLPLPRFELQLYGAGHVGRAIVRLLADLPCRVGWIDEREEEFPPGPLPPHIERICVEPVQAEVAQAPPGACFLVLTHSHALDLALAQAILARGDFAWFGLIGSRSKRARFEARLRERGCAPELLARMTCPIGLPGITGKEPEVIALAVVAQLLLQVPAR
ncbi:XdhC protein (assists in molybdopterin insertion into xanthine dehydrogenase) [Rubrivivax sp. A210]|uniref:xanthine dehydrogenase accessory protein XdhC n=1 Tax=Rubrivivax sp. A210 TaxID=2772301 RepID=UPI00191A6E2B|nr:xanthine dehydrogenase accessory protein XdhC [Rubrivivax sp. A210]CAD5372447.1 XdhC protein (assists in molybdopterin insertion into xanthine dehydrogenase) [Rubrivivax sp. A210]